MADYNIYIHEKNDGGSGKSSKPTTAWNREDNGTSEGGSKTSGWVSKTTKTINAVQNPDSLVSNGTSAVAKAVPWVAIAYAVLKLGTASVDEYYSFASTETGSYGGSMVWENKKKALSAILTPFSTTMNYFHAVQQERIYNQKRELERELLGDSEINSYNKRGV